MHDIGIDIGTRNFSFCVVKSKTFDIVEWKLIDIYDKDTLKMCQNIKKIFDEVCEKFPIERVFVEKQMKAKMLVIEAYTSAYFINNNIKIERVNPIVKLKGCPEFFEEIKNVKSAYTRRKKQAELWIAELIKDSPFYDFYIKSKKRSDLADSSLYCYQNNKIYCNNV